MFPNVNPATEEIIGVTADATDADLDRAIGAARRAFDETAWADRPHPARCAACASCTKGCSSTPRSCARSSWRRPGAPVTLTRGPQLDVPVEGVAWVADLARDYAWETDLGVAAPMGITTHRFLRREPAGVVGAITPWNFPMQINLAKVAPALAAGNTVVLKPAPDTPWTATILGRIVAEETDIPAGVFNVVASSRHETGQRLAEDPRVDMISFTGSTATGRAVMRAGAASIKKVFLELGGKSALLVLDDADLGAALGHAAFHITTHAGQGCAVLSRLVLPRARYDEGVETDHRDAARLAGRRPGRPQLP